MNNRPNRTAAPMQLPCGSAGGRGIKVTTTADPGDVVHSVPADRLGPDALWLYAANNDSSDHTLTVELGGSLTSDQFTLTVPANSGLNMILPGLLLSAGLTLRAFASAANKLTVFSFIRRWEDFDPARTSRPGNAPDVISFSRARILSGSTGGRGISIGTSATLVHHVPTHDIGTHAVWFYATNNDSTDRTLTVDFGGTESPFDVLVPANSLTLVVPGLPINPGADIQASASVGNVLAVFGLVRTIEDFDG